MSKSRPIPTALAAAAIAAALTAALPPSALAGATPAQKCEAGKNGAAGKYAACLHTAQLKFLKGGAVNPAGRDADVAACGATYAGKWESLETKAGDGVCPSEDDAADVQEYLDACINGVEGALHGGTLPLDAATCQTQLEDVCLDDLDECTGELSSCNGSAASCTADLAIIDGGTAAPGDVFAGKTFSSAAGRNVAGTMPDNGTVMLTPTTADQPIAAGYHSGSGTCAGDADLVPAKIKRGVNLFGVVGTVTPAGLAESGQISCYNVAGSAIPCSGTGQDGAVLAGAPNSFTDNGNGTITDNVTGLVWEKLSDDGSIHDKADRYYAFDAIPDKIAGLNASSFAGHNDWRLPNRNELLTLLNLGAGNPAAFSSFNTACSSGCSVLACNCTEPERYWTSSTNLDRPSEAWFVDFYDGESLVNDKASLYRVRAVRGGA